MLEKLVSDLSNTESDCEGNTYFMIIRQRKLLEEFRTNHEGTYPQLDGAIEGKFSFSELADILEDTYGGFKTLLPFFRTKRHKKLAEEISKRNTNDFVEFNNFGLSSNKGMFNRIFTNPFGAALIGAAAAYLVVLITAATQGDIQPRFYLDLLQVAKLGAGTGGLVGTATGVGKYIVIKQITEQLNYLQEVIENCYLKNTVSVR